MHLYCSRAHTQVYDSNVGAVLTWIQCADWRVPAGCPLAQFATTGPHRDRTARWLCRRESIYPTSQSAGPAIPPGHLWCSWVTKWPFCSYKAVTTECYHLHWLQLHMQDWGKGRQDCDNAVQTIWQAWGSWGRTCGRTRGMASVARCKRQRSPSGPQVSNFIGSHCRVTSWVLEDMDVCRRII